MTWGILYSGSSHEEVTNATTNATIDVSVCGTADCQAPDVTEANIEQYEPGSPAAFYGTVSTLTALVMVSVVISVLTIPEIDENKEYSEDDEEEDSFITVAETKDGVVIVDRKEPNRPPPKKVEYEKYHINPACLTLTLFVFRFWHCCVTNSYTRDAACMCKQSKCLVSIINNFQIDSSLSKPCHGPSILTTVYFQWMDDIVYSTLFKFKLPFEISILEHLCFNYLGRIFSL